jgi:hypothetical protein
MKLDLPDFRQVKLAALRAFIGIDETSWYSSQVYPLLNVPVSILILFPALPPV